MFDSLCITSQDGVTLSVFDTAHLLSLCRLVVWDIPYMSTPGARRGVTLQDIQERQERRISKSNLFKSAFSDSRTVPGLES